MIHPFFRSVRFLSILLFVFALAGCTAHQSPETVSEAKADKIYREFRTTYGTCNATGLRAGASLYYTSKGSGHRTTMTLWGEYLSPLRLDVRAGIGAYIAHIREDNAGLTAFYPDQKTAYSHSSPVRAVKILGLPFPFSLKDLAGLISGCYPNLIPESYDSAAFSVENGEFSYSYENGPVSSITLTEQGLPVEISGRGEISWRMELSSYEEDLSGKLLPDRIAVYTEAGDKALLRIKSRTFTAKPWQAKALELRLPEGSEEIRLDRNGYVRIDPNV